MHTMNASLRLSHFLENNQAFPSHEDLYEHLEAEREQHLADRQCLSEREGDEEIAMGWRLWWFASKQDARNTWMQRINCSR